MGRTFDQPGINHFSGHLPPKSNPRHVAAYVQLNKTEVMKMAFDADGLYHSTAVIFASSRKLLFDWVLRCVKHWNLKMCNFQAPCLK